MLTQDTITDAEAEELARLRTRADASRLPSDPPVTRQLAINDLRPSVDTYRFDFYGLFGDDGLVGFAEVFGTVGAENTDLAEIGIITEPDGDSRTIHRTLFDHIEAIERRRGRERFWGWGDLANDATHTFWQNELGYSLAFEERISRCDIADVDADLMQRWIDRAAERASGYELVRAEAPFSDEHLALWAVGLEGMNDEPTDDLVFEEETFDIDRARQIQELHLSTRSSFRAIFAIERATGELAGFTAVRIPDAEPEFVKQNDTVTIEAHRNRGIGRWLKADMWQWLRSDHPEAAHISTGNAESNRAMLAINEAMGFRDVIHHGVWQKNPE